MTIVDGSAVAAATRWRLLSLGFASPTVEIVRELETLAGALEDLAGNGEMEDLLEALRDTSVDALAADYHALFGGSVRISPYEGGYELDPLRQSRQISDVAAFYRAFGADTHGPAAERPDHVGCELEFLAYLELRHVASVQEDDAAAAAVLDDVATSFLRDHAGRWLPTFFAELHEVALERPVYRALALLGLHAVESELEARRVECTPVRPVRERIPVERDSFDCG